MLKCFYRMTVLLKYFSLYSKGMAVCVGHQIQEIYLHLVHSITSIMIKKQSIVPTYGLTCLGLDFRSTVAPSSAATNGNTADG